jgi:hypothetical protein
MTTGSGGCTAHGCTVQGGGAELALSVSVARTSTRVGAVGLVVNV